LLTVVFVMLAALPAGCPVTPTEPTEFTNANTVRGGLLYDKWWTVAGATEPTTDHALWATRPNIAGNTRSGADTWRCKECHGWDYKGVDGAYGSGSHLTGIAGINSTMLTAQEVFDLIKTNHGFGAAGLSDTDIWDLARFVLLGQIDTDDIIDANGAFTGSATSGQTLYANGIGSNLACAVCHGADGQTINFADAADPEYIGGLANGNPWETQHKIRFGHPGSAMPSSITGGGTNQDVNDVGAHAQTLQ
jgi:thiosulfate dehydrogenase